MENLKINQTPVKQAQILNRPSPVPRETPHPPEEQHHGVLSECPRLIDAGIPRCDCEQIVQKRLFPIPPAVARIDKLTRFLPQRIGLEPHHSGVNGARLE